MKPSTALMRDHRGGTLYRKQDSAFMPLRLKTVLAAAGLTQGDWAEALRQTWGTRAGQRMSHAYANTLLNWNTWPRQFPRDEIVAQTEAWLRGKGVPEAQIGQIWEVDESGASDHAHPARLSPSPLAGEGRGEGAQDKETDMLLSAEPLCPEARKAFGLFTDPFKQDLTDPADVYVWPAYRYCREALAECARNGGFRAIVGESGSGKTTLREELEERIARERQHNIVLLEPYVVGMEETESKGKELRSTAIAECIIRTLAPHATIRQSPERRFRQAHELLVESSRAGYRHLLLIEEAHSLPVSTLKHLKRWREMKDGLRALVGIALIGQPELRTKLDPRNPAVREVAQRCELVELEPLDRDLEAYVAHRLGRAGVSAELLFEPSTWDAVRQRLTYSGNRGGRGPVSMLYPLAVGNLLVRALNRAALACVPRVNRDIVLEA